MLGGGGYWPAFQRHRGVTQGDPLSPTIFNMIFYAFIQHWAKILGEAQEGSRKEGPGMSIQDLSALFYANDGLVASTKSARLQGSFDNLTGLFGRVGLRTNKGKTVSMAFCPCHTPQSWSLEAYTRQVMGMVLYYRDRL